MEFLQQILGEDIGVGLTVVFNLIIIESLLSVDNAAVLATMVMDLPPHQRARALRYGIIGAYVFRGICLVLAAWLLKFWWLKPLGGLYLLYLAFSYWRGQQTPQTEDDLLNKEENFFYRNTLGLLGKFWATVVLVEVMDLAFSIDNVLAAAAYTDNIYLICIGVFIGILAMRFVAQSFVRLIERFPFLEACAFIVIAILGIKLTLSLYTHFNPGTTFSVFMEGIPHDQLQAGSHQIVPGDILTSVLTIAIFVVPVLTSIFLNYPARTPKPEA